MLSIVRGAGATVVVAIALALAGCTPAPEPMASPTTSAAAPEAASAEPTPTPTPSPAIELPDCDTIYSPAMVAQLTAESRVRDAVGVSSPGSLDDRVSALFDSLVRSVSCGWYLPASESGSTTTIAIIDDAARTELEAALGAGGFSAATTADGELYSIRVEEEFITYEESHLVFDDVWIGTLYVGGSAEPLTLDAYAQLAP